MSRAKRITSLLLAMVVLVGMFSCFSLSASAATSGNMNNSASITVVTKASYWYAGSSSITLKQNKTNYTYTSGSKTKTGSMYASWTVKIYNCSTKKTVTKSFTGSSLKINLDKNTTYKITVTYNSTSMLAKTLGKVNFKWKSTPSWSVGSTWKVSKYY